MSLGRGRFKSQYCDIGEVEAETQVDRDACPLKKRDPMFGKQKEREFEGEAGVL